jgi:hypothetical protein
MPRLALIVALLLLTAATARALTGGYNDRVRVLLGEAEAQRKKLGLESPDRRDALFAKYPTPEVTFGGELPRLSCGQTVPLKITGHWPKGTTFLLSNDDAQLSDIKDDGHTWQATLKTAAAAIGGFELHAIAPVSGAQAATSAGAIRARYELELKFEDGWTAHFVPSEADAGSGQLQGPLQWRKGQGSREGVAQVSPGDGSLRIDIQPTPERMKVSGDMVAKLQTLGSEEPMQQAMKSLEECMKKSGDAQAACLQQANAAAEKAGDAMKKKMDAIQAEAAAKEPADAWNCSQLELTARAGVLSGTANCTGDKKQRVTGAIKCLGPIALSE